MVRYIHRYIFFCLAVLILLTANHFSIHAQDNPPEFIYTRWIDKAVFKGIAEIYILEKEAGGEILFHPNCIDKIYYRYMKGEDNRMIYEIDYKQKTKRIMFDPKEYFPKDKRGYTTPFRFQFLNNTTMICLVTDKYKKDNGEVVDELDKIFKINIDTNEVDMEIKKWLLSEFMNYNLRAIASYDASYYGQKRQLNTYNYTDNVPKMYNIIQIERIGENIKIYQTTLGRNKDELIIRCRRVEKNDVGELLGNTRIVFYNVKDDKIEKMLILPGKAKNNPQANFTGGDIYLMPNQEDFIIRGSTGLWLYRLKTEELICLVWWKEGSDITLRLKDISWDSKNLLLYLYDGIYSGLYILNIDEYLKYNPEGKRLFFSPMFSNSPVNIKTGFVSN